MIDTRGQGPSSGIVVRINGGKNITLPQDMPSLFEWAVSPPYESISQVSREIVVANAVNKFDRSSIAPALNAHLAFKEGTSMLAADAFNRLLKMEPVLALAVAEVSLVVQPTYESAISVLCEISLSVEFENLRKIAKSTLETLDQTRLSENGRDALEHWRDDVRAHKTVQIPFARPPAVPESEIEGARMIAKAYFEEGEDSLRKIAPLALRGLSRPRTAADSVLACYAALTIGARDSVFFKSHLSTVLHNTEDPMLKLVCDFFTAH